MKNILLIICTFLSFKISAQSITIQPGTNADPAMFKIENQATGNQVRSLELPIVSTEERQRFPNPKTGSTVFDKESNQICTFLNVATNQKYWVGTQNIFQVPNQIIPSSALNNIGFGDGSNMTIFYDTLYNLSHELFAVAAPNDANGKGAVFIFKINKGITGSYNQVAKVTASDGVAGDEFGTSIGIMDGYLVVGSPKHNGGRGAVYVYKVTAQSPTAFLWTETSKIFKPLPVVNDLFGSNVKISRLNNNSDTAPIIAVTCPGDDLNSPVVTDIGSVLVFKENILNLWIFIQIIKDASGINGEGLGMKLCLQYNRILAWSKNPTPTTGKISSVIYNQTSNILTEKKTIILNENILDFDMSYSSDFSSFSKLILGLNNKVRIYNNIISENFWTLEDTIIPVGFTGGNFGYDVKFKKRINSFAGSTNSFAVRDYQNHYVAIYAVGANKPTQRIYFPDFTSNNYPKGSMLYYNDFLFLGDGGSSATSPGKFYGLDVNFQF